jgi:hypothetical protein
MSEPFEILAAFLTFPAAEAVYILCTLTSLACACLLLRGYRRTRARLLLWSGLCFVGLTVNNSLLFVDLVVLSQTMSLLLLRNLTALVSMCLLLFGLIWESE